MREATIIFGTDGWRGEIANDYTFANVRRCAQGFASYLQAKGLANKGLVIGHDKRFQSENFAAACAEVIAGNGIRVWLTDGATPTPVISYAAVYHQSAGAINITASHNPPTDNGFKVRDPNGGAIDPEGLKQIEALIPSEDGVKTLPLNDAKAQGLVQVFDASIPYIEHLKGLIDLEPIKNAGFKIVVEPMWGNGAGWFPRLLSGGKTEVIEVHNERNPIFPEMHRPEPIPPNVNVGLKKTVELGADVCLITDGDADRMGVGDENGRFVNQLEVYALMALYFLEVRGERGAIVKTLSTTSMLEKLGKLYDVPVISTGVGFKYIAPKFMEVNALLGGEESGGYAFRGNVPERDGILGNLYMLDFMVKTGKKPSELLAYLFSKVGAHYYDRIDTRCTPAERDAVKDHVLNAKPQTIGGLKVTELDLTDGFKFLMGEDGWVLIRLSGTEPIVRVYTETTHQDKVPAILQDGLKIAGLK
ncbi:MAG TPA: phosphoglucomutase/phosphomannomutase family protein [Anaerolineae bacterium]|nr:phosphoglucomutase/phosphomannomutase family protein [Anaerolineae bacterium]